MDKPFNLEFIRKDEVFTWENDEKSCSIIFFITALTNGMMREQVPYETLTTEIDPKFAQIQLPRRDIDLAYCREMSDDQAARPVLGVRLPDNSVLLIDGSHRYMAQWLRGHTLIDMHLVPLGHWERFALILGDITKA